MVASLGGLVLVGWGLGELAESFVQTSDLDVIRNVAAHRTPFLTAVARAFSLVGSKYVVLPLAVVGCAVLYRRGRSRASLAVAVSTVGAILIATVDKLLVGRPRPPVHHLEHVTTASFPSEHTLQATAFYGALLIVFLHGGSSRRRAVSLVAATTVLVLGVALSRVYLGVHYPSDVAGGALLGASWAVITTSLLLTDD